ncbi:MAG: 1-(5-phosphoribosyl)-5-[(5-phosphoribosylamino)methylideneamino]imidazole-4-carboxamide isomerase [Magnetococcus sp. DMHC-6]
MIVIPAIDLKDGQCVRLFQGDMNQNTVYSNNPAAMAQQWSNQGAKRLHVVDLDGAFAGKPVNASSIQAILNAVTIPVQLGGGVRNLDTIASSLEMGIFRIILGTIACQDPALVQEACRLFPGRISVGIDAKDGYVAVRGWAEITNLKVIDLARRFENVGVSEIIFTDIRRDGALQGPNIPATLELAEAISIPVILSGGITSIEDFRALAKHRVPFASGGYISGVITGKALYDGRVDFQQAQSIIEFTPSNTLSS